MLKFSRERINHLAKLIAEAMDREGSFRAIKDRDAIRQAIANTIFEESRHDDERRAHALARMPIAAESPGSGTREWDLLFEKLLDEEYGRDGNGKE